MDARISSVINYAQQQSLLASFNATTHPHTIHNNIIITPNKKKCVFIYYCNATIRTDTVHARVCGIISGGAGVGEFLSIGTRFGEDVLNGC